MERTRKFTKKHRQANPLKHKVEGSGRNGRGSSKAIASTQRKCEDTPTDSDAAIKGGKSEESDAELIRDYLQNLDSDSGGFFISNQLQEGGEFSDGVHFSTPEEEDIIQFFNKLELEADPDSFAETELQEEEDEVKDIIVYPAPVEAFNLRSGQAGSSKALKKLSPRPKKDIEQQTEVQYKDDEGIVWSVQLRRPIKGIIRSKPLPSQQPIKKLLQKTPKPPKEEEEMKEEVNIEEINNRILEFARDELQASLCFPPMARNERQVVHHLAVAYGLKSRSHKGGRNRFTKLEKPDTYKGFIGNRVSNVLNRIVREARRGKNDFTLWPIPKPQPKIKGAGREKPLRVPREKPPRVPKKKSSSIVAENAPEISNSNIGHQLLSKMGWTPGQSLGTSGGGIINPVEAVVRVKRRGLGA